jgi:hypothetical protein
LDAAASVTQPIHGSWIPAVSMEQDASRHDLMLHHTMSTKLGNEIHHSTPHHLQDVTQLALKTMPVRQLVSTLQRPLSGAEQRAPGGVPLSACGQ